MPRTSTKSKQATKASLKTAPKAKRKYTKRAEKTETNVFSTAACTIEFTPVEDAALPKAHVSPPVPEYATYKRPGQRPVKIKIGSWPSISSFEKTQQIDGSMFTFFIRVLRHEDRRMLVVGESNDYGKSPIKRKSICELLSAGATDEQLYNAINQICWNIGLTSPEQVIDTLPAKEL